MFGTRRLNTVCIILLLMTVLSVAMKFNESFALPQTVYICPNNAGSESGPETKTEATAESGPRPAPYRRNNCFYRPETAYTGQDYKCVDALSADECCEFCRQDGSKCKAWVYNSNDNKCRLKSTKTGEKRCAAKTSGYVSEPTATATVGVSGTSTPTHGVVSETPSTAAAQTTATARPQACQCPSAAPVPAGQILGQNAFAQALSHASRVQGQPSENSENVPFELSECVTLKGVGFSGPCYYRQQAINDFECCRICRMDSPRCVGWSYEDDSRYCTLKSDITGKVSNKKMTSGFVQLKPPQPPPPPPSPPAPPPQPPPAPATSPAEQTTAAQTLWSTMDVGWDHNGSDYANVPSDSPQQCSKACIDANPTCQTWTHVAGRCYLKNATPDVIQSPSATTGQVLKANESSIYGAVGRNGDDYRRQPAGSASECATACMNERSRCRSWTFGDQTCYLKSAVPELRVASGTYTGQLQPTGQNHAQPANASSCTGECQNMLIAKDGGCRIAAQTNGDFCLYDKDHKYLWGTMTDGKGTPPYHLIMGGDGNLTLYDVAYTPIWQSNTAGKGSPPYSFVMEDNCDAVIYDKDHSVIWSTGTAGKG